jgi:hypothetical protein
MGNAIPRNHCTLSDTERAIDTRFQRTVLSCGCSFFCISPGQWISRGHVPALAGLKTSIPDSLNCFQRTHWTGIHRKR